MSDLRNMRVEGLRELENAQMRCTNNDENNNDMDRVEVIDLCSVSQNINDVFSDEKERQSKKVRTNRNSMVRTKWKSN